MEQQKDNQKSLQGESRQFSQGQSVVNNEHRATPSAQPQTGFVKQTSMSQSTQGFSGTLTQKKPSPQQGFDYVMRKAEKLTTALYLVTYIMSEREPLKWKTREIGVDLLSDITITSALSLSEKMSMLRNIMKKIEKTIAFLDVAQSARLMSEMNSSMLKKEYLALKDSIDGEWGRVHEKSKSIFSEAFFDISREEEPLTESSSRESTVFIQRAAEPVTERTIERPPVKEVVAPAKTERPESQPTPAPRAPFVLAVPVETQQVSAKVVGERVEKQAPQTGRQEERAAGTVANTQLPANAPRPTAIFVPPNRLPMQGGGVLVAGRAENDKNDRRKIILALIKQKPALTVRDITKSIPQVSEKTIQRELLSMVAEGVLLKRGERRWSTYSLRVQ